MSDPVGARADGVVGDLEGEREDTRIHGTRRAKSCVGLVANEFHGWIVWVAVIKGRGEFVLPDYTNAESGWNSFCDESAGARVRISFMKRSAWMRRLTALVLSLAIGCVGAAAQQSSAAENDAEVVAGSLLVGKGLFLRGF
jgi:hypothetical protein